MEADILKAALLFDQEELPLPVCTQAFLRPARTDTLGVISVKQLTVYATFTPMFLKSACCERAGFEPMKHNRVSGLKMLQEWSFYIWIVIEMI